MTTQINQESLEIYIKYKRLETTDLIDLMSRVNELYNEIKHIVYRETSSLSMGIQFEEFLEISSINTGESIRIKFINGIKKKSIGGILTPYANKKIILYIVLSLLSNVHDLNEIEKEKIKLKIAETELRMKEIDHNKSTNNQKLITEQEVVKNNTTQFIQFVNSNNNFITVEINNCKTK